MIWYIFINCNWVDTRWQQYSTHLHTNSTQNNTNNNRTANRSSGQIMNIFVQSTSTPQPRKWRTTDRIWQCVPQPNCLQAAPAVLHHTQCILQPADDKFKDTTVLSLSPITTTSTFLSFSELLVKEQGRAGPDSSPFGFGFLAKTASYGFTRLGTKEVATEVRHDADGHPYTMFCVCDWCRKQF